MAIKRYKVPVEELLIGPTPHPTLARDSARALLSSCGLPSLTVRSSSIPYARSNEHV